jgi:hypothetical protein
MRRLSTDARLERTDSLDVHIAGSRAERGVALAQLGWAAVWFSALSDPPHELGLGREPSLDGM